MDLILLLLFFLLSNLLPEMATDLLQVSCYVAITLNPKTHIWCPGDTVVFTCVTDTGYLVWEVNNTKSIFSMEEQSSPLQIYIFTFNLINITGTMVVSTATVNNILLEHNQTVISCGDSTNPSSVNVAEETMVISGPPSPPLNLTFTSSPTLSSVTISWVAPLDTPLCVHSYTVTVRNSCNSSQVLVYNTTDNRSSLSITDLTSDGEYSVTVAGRDGAGRLGLEIEGLIMNLTYSNYITNLKHSIITMEGRNLYGILIRWNAGQFHEYLIIHNVSSDQSPITVNRTNVTLYGVQPGETYTVEITPNKQRKLSGRFTFQIVDVAKNEESSNCCGAENAERDKKLTEGHIMTIVASVVLVFITTCYSLICIIEKLCAPRREFNDNSTAFSSTPFDDGGRNYKQ